MSKQLILFRHAKSDWDAPYSSDHSRPLAKRGIKAAKAMGRFLMDTGLIPDQVVSSSAVRAMATVQLAAKAGGWIAPITKKESLYLPDSGAVVEEIRTRAGDGPMYFSIDIDGLDPSECPGTGYPEPGGLTMREMQRMMRGCRGIDFIGADLCEVSPALDPSGNTALVGAHLMFEQLCLMAEAIARRKGRIS